MRLCLIAIAACASACLVARPAAANSAPPPPKLWLRFVDVSGNFVTPQGVQLQLCARGDCAAPVLSHHSGQCDGTPCLAGPAKYEGTFYGRFECGRGACVAGLPLPANGADGQEWLRAVVQYPDGVRATDAFIVLTSMASTTTYGVRVDGARLAAVRLVENPSTLELLTQPTAQFVGNYVFTVFVELLVAFGLLFALGRNLAGAALNTLWVAAANVLSFPAVWLFFPSLGQWQDGGAFGFGGALAAGAAIVAGLIAWARNTPHTPARVAAIVLAVLAVPAFFMCSLIFGFAFGYGNAFPNAGGLPFLGMIALAEAAAVVFEGLALWLFSRRDVALPRALGVSFACNAASFGLGLIAMFALQGVSLAALT